MAGITRRSFRRGSASPWRAISLAVVAMVAAGGCFTGPINRPPVISQLGEVGQAARGQPATFMALGSDPDQDQLTWTWATTPGDCAGDPAVMSTWPSDRHPGQADAPATFVVDSSLTSGRFCVWAFATDRYGAGAARYWPFVPVDNAPVAVIRLVSPNLSNSYPAYSQFELSGADSTDPDGDTLTYKWTWEHRPLGSMTDFVPCDGESNVDDDETRRCFRADKPDMYVVSLTVSDGSMMTSQATLALMVLPDAPPCIQATDPKYMPDSPVIPLAPSEMSGVTISVTQAWDDLDSQQITYTWYKSANDDKPKYVDNHDFPQLLVSYIDYPGAQFVNVRLEVSDQVPDTTAQVLAKCGSADFCTADTPAPNGDVCYVRVSWRFQLPL